MDTTPTHPVLRSLWAGFSIGAGLQSRSEVDPRGYSEDFPATITTQMTPLDGIFCLIDLDYLGLGWQRK